MKKIIKLMLNDKDYSTYIVGEVGTSSIFLSELCHTGGTPFEPAYPIFIVQFDNGKPDVEIPYHSVLLIRREK